MLMTWQVRELVMKRDPATYKRVRWLFVKEALRGYLLKRKRDLPNRDDDRPTGACRASYAAVGECIGAAPAAAESAFVERVCTELRRFSGVANGAADQADCMDLQGSPFATAAAVTSAS
jgi:hypothetical protein